MYTRPARLLALTAGSLLSMAPALRADLQAGNIVVSRTVYAGTPAMITIGQALPGGGSAVADGGYPEVWQNDTVDASFGVTSPIYVDELTPGGSTVSTLAVDSTQIVTSFSSKSELSLNTSPDGPYITMAGYVATPNQLDVSNSNTAGHVAAHNPVSLVYARAAARLDFSGNLLVTPVNAYSGNNARAVILAGGNYYFAGNAGNSTSAATGAEVSMLSDNTGIQMIGAGISGETTVVGAVQGTSGATSGYQHGYSVVQYGYAADKTGKDDNFRGLTLFGNTLFATKGSGGNGIDTVFQVGAVGSLPTSANAGTAPITVLPGLPIGLARNITANNTATEFYPFGIWFANATTLYVGDEGSGGNSGVDTPAANPHAGLQKWVYDGTQWQLAYTLQAGLNLGVTYAVADGPGGVQYPAAMYPATDGLRNIAGSNNGDGTVTIYAVTSTVSTSGDQGADPNKLVSITDSLAATTLPAGESFTTLKVAGYGEVLRGVAVVPPTTCYANCDASTIPPVLNVLDFACFLNRFAAGDTYANCDASTIPPVLNVLDFACFLNRFAAGCP
jgi:hypothetical protein